MIPVGCMLPGDAPAGYSITGWLDHLKRYHCVACDVFGKGDECWCCGGIEVVRGRTPNVLCGQSVNESDEPPLASLLAPC